jgi:hydroxypyruvate isomerase
MILHRREFLIGSAGAAWAQSGPPPAAKIISSAALGTLPGRFEEKLQAVARAGIQAVELVEGEHLEWSSTELEQARRTVRSFNLIVDVISAAPEWTATLDLVRKFEARMVLLQERETYWPNLVESYRKAAEQARQAGLTAIVAARPGTPITTAADALRLVKQVDHQYLRLLFDVHDEHKRSGDVVKGLDAAGPYVKVVHVADTPDRAEPGKGSIPFDAFYRTLAKLPYEGPVAMAYKPSGDTATSLIRAVDSMRKSLSTPAPPPKA